MPSKIPLNFSAILLSFLCIQVAPATSLLSSQETKKKVAVLKITYEAFSPAEQNKVNSAFYSSLAQDKRIALMAEIQAQNELMARGIDAAELNEQEGFIRAGQVLRVGYVLVGKMEKVGDFVEVTFQLFAVPRALPKVHRAGKAIDLLVQEEIPKIVDQIKRDLGLEPPQKGAKKWPWLALGGVTIGIAIALLIPGEYPAPPDLPGPPKLP